MKTKNTPLCTGNEWKCQQCKTWVDKERYFSNQHICREYKCSSCKEFVAEGHRCYIKKIDKYLNQLKMYGPVILKPNLRRGLTHC